jgi:1,4-alpha-glucan branching enzyme
MPKAKSLKQKVTFACAAPEARTVLLAGDFTGWETAPLPLKKQKGGGWTTTVSLAEGRYQYRFLVDGQWKDDPSCPLRQPNEFGTQNCVCVVRSGA